MITQTVKPGTISADEWYGVLDAMAMQGRGKVSLGDKSKPMALVMEDDAASVVQGEDVPLPHLTGSNVHYYDAKHLSRVDATDPELSRYAANARILDARGDLWKKNRDGTWEYTAQPPSHYGGCTPTVKTVRGDVLDTVKDLRATEGYANSSMKISRVGAEIRFNVRIREGFLLQPWEPSIRIGLPRIEGLYPVDGWAPLARDIPLSRRQADNAYGETYDPEYVMCDLSADGFLEPQMGTDEYNKRTWDGPKSMHFFVADFSFSVTPYGRLEDSVDALTGKRDLPDQ